MSDALSQPESYRDFIRSILGDRVVAYYPSLARRFGVKSAILLSQLFHYASLQEDPDDWFHAKITTIHDHTGMTKKEQVGARKVLSQWDVLKVERRGMSRKNWYKLDLEALVLAVSEDAVMPEPPEPALPERNELPEPAPPVVTKGHHRRSPKSTTGSAERAPRIKESFKESLKDKEEEIGSLSQDEWVLVLIYMKRHYYPRPSNDKDYDHFWGDTGFAGRKNGKYQVVCRDKKHRDYLDSHGTKMICENALLNVLGEKVEVEFVVEG